LRITHLSTSDLGGGAARATYRLHSALRQLGQESRLLALIKESPDSSVIPFAPPTNWPIRLRRQFRRLPLGRSFRTIGSRPSGSTYFSDDRSQHAADVLHQVPPSDVLHLHWIAGLLDYRDSFRCLPQGLPIIWTLHDMNPFTGGCHFDGGCGKYVERCGACPELGSSKADDLSAEIWRRKHTAFSAIRSALMHLATPSRWLAAEVKKSSLLGDLPVAVIPYGIDTEKFRPRDQSLARQVLGVPAQANVILFVADHITEKRKGMSLLLEAIKGLEGLTELCFLTVGREAGRQELGKRTIAIEHVRDDRILSWIYSAADLFVIPSLQDNLPLTALEALACGIPTVGFKVGGVPDIVHDGQTGVLVAPGDVRALRGGITELLQNPERRVSMAEASRRIAVQEFALDVQARRYIRLYEIVTRERKSPEIR
jgi:glycosyltransferase involved in cell wall biosynthesis